MDDYKIGVSLAVTADAGIPIRQAKWTLIRDGVVQTVAFGASFLMHPFGHLGEPVYMPPAPGVQAEIPRTGLAVFPATGHEVAAGYLVDSKGNFTPPEGRTGAIPPHLPAYHQGPGTVQSTANLNAALSGNGPVTKEEPDAAQNEALPGTVDATVTTQDQHDEARHEADAAREEAPEPTGFAAIDAQAHG